MSQNITRIELCIQLGLYRLNASKFVFKTFLSKYTKILIMIDFFSHRQIIYSIRKHRTEPSCPFIMHKALWPLRASKV